MNSESSAEKVGEHQKLEQGVRESSQRIEKIRTQMVRKEPQTEKNDINGFAYNSEPQKNHSHELPQEV